MDTTDSDRFLPDWLTRCAEGFPRRLAVQDGQVRWSFANLQREAGRVARQLAARGVREGDRVALLAGNSAACAAFVHALTRLGATLVPLNVRLTVAELCWQLRDVRAALLVSDERYAAIAAEIGRELPDLPRATLGETDDEQGDASVPTPHQLHSRPYIDLEATQAIMYTSGTTGQPKGALITYGMQWWNAIGSALNLGLSAHDRWLACLPLFHIGGLSILMKSVIYGMGVIVHERFDPVAVNRSIGEDGITMISVVAVMLQRMLDALNTAQPGSGYPAALRCVLLGGGPAPYPLLEECARRGIPVVQTYGLTESCSQAVTLAPGDALRKPGSAGRPLLPVQLRILRDGQPALTGEAGEIYLRGPTITPGYADQPAATARAFQDGWLATGDIGCLDAEGYLYVLDRRADLIVSGGENIYPAEIEGVLLAHPDVIETGVCGQFDAQWGQVPIAFVHLRDGSETTAAALLVYAEQRLARYKLPRAVHLVGPLPRNSAGKLVRRELRAMIP